MGANGVRIAGWRGNREGERVVVVGEEWQWLYQVNRVRTWLQRESERRESGTSEAKDSGGHINEGGGE